MQQQWKWTVYPKNKIDVMLYEYLRSLDRMKEAIIQALEAFYLPYALQFTGSSPVEIQKAYQKSIDALQSRARIMSIDAGIKIDNTVTSGQLESTYDRASVEDTANSRLPLTKAGLDPLQDL